jgi:phosphatidate cytidylyltransferase
MALNLPTFYKRLGSSIVFVAVMLMGLLWNEWAFLVLVCLIQVLCLREYFRLVQNIDKETYWPKWLPIVIQVTGLTILVPILYLGHLLDSSFIAWPLIIWGIIPAVPAVLLLASVLSKKNSFIAMLQSIGGLFYITLPVLLLLDMRLQNFILPLALILMIWSNDTMAYLVGSFIGKTPFSSISPKKTWEGTIGGVVLTITGAALCGYFTHTFRMADWIMLALCATVAGTLGDMLESKLKRIADVKDSGNLMPGHGGALDRFDSLLIATPFAFLYVHYFMR